MRKTVSGQLCFTDCFSTFQVERICKEEPEVNKKLAEDIAKKVKFFGNKKLVEKTKEEVLRLPLTGNEASDRLLIQSFLDDAGKMADILYDGTTVYPFKKLSRELERMKKTDSIHKMSNQMYQFLSQNFDIAHYNKNGFIDYYNGRYENLYKETLIYSRGRVPNRLSDIKKIAYCF